MQGHVFPLSARSSGGLVCITFCYVQFNTDKLRFSRCCSAFGGICKLFFYVQVLSFKKAGDLILPFKMHYVKIF